MGSVLVDVDYTGTDADNTPSNVLVQYSFDGATPVGVCTPAVSDPAHDGISSLPFTSGGAGLTFVWDAEADLGPAFTGDVYVHITPDDGIDTGTIQVSNGVTITTIDAVVPQDAFPWAVKTVLLRSGAHNASINESRAAIFNILTDLQNIRGALFTINARAAAGATVPELTTKIAV